jgi:outer membrane protein assembly factor BamB
MTLFFKRLTWGCALLGLTGCATTPPPRQIKFNVEWIRSTLGAENYGYRHAERTAPVTDGDTIFDGNGVDGFAALDKATGRLIWRKQILHGVESGAAVVSDAVYFGASDGQFYAVDKFTGKTLWTFPTRSETLSVPLIEEGIVYFLAGNNVLYALDAKTGKQIWFYNRGETSSLSIRGGARPTLFKGTLYEGFSDGFLAAINARDGSLIWERKLNGNLKFIDVDATPVVDDANIWVSSFDGSLYCLSRVDGQVQWRLDDGGSTPVTIDGDTLYYAATSQAIYALNKKTGTQKWKFSFEEKFGVPTQPVLYKGLVIFGASDGDVYALSQATGKSLTRYRPGAGVFATPLIDIDRGWVYVLSNQANVHALHVAWRRARDDYEWK